MFCVHDGRSLKTYKKKSPLKTSFDWEKVTKWVKSKLIKVKINWFLYYVYTDNVITLFFTTHASTRGCAEITTLACTYILFLTSISEIFNLRRSLLFSAYSFTNFDTLLLLLLEYKIASAGCPFLPALPVCCTGSSRVRGNPQFIMQLISGMLTPIPRHCWLQLPVAPNWFYKIALKSFPSFHLLMLQ